jgi:hypothetical protein
MCAATVDSKRQLRTRRRTGHTPPYRRHRAGYSFLANSVKRAMSVPVRVAKTPAACVLSLSFAASN